MYTVAGVSRFKGQTKVRFCKDLVLRVKNLQKQGDVDIDLTDLPRPMSKAEACEFLLEQSRFEDFHYDIMETLEKKKG